MVAETAQIKVAGMMCSFLHHERGEGAHERPGIRSVLVSVGTACARVSRHHQSSKQLLVRSGDLFQQLAHVDTVVFNKAGTLTYVRLTMTDVAIFGIDETEPLVPRNSDA